MSLLTLINNIGLLEQTPLPSVNEAILFGVKSLFVAGGILYILFAILVSRQITIMAKTVTTTASGTIKFLGFLHLIFSIFVLIYFFIVL